MRPKQEVMNCDDVLRYSESSVDVHLLKLKILQTADVYQAHNYAKTNAVSWRGILGQLKWAVSLYEPNSMKNPDSYDHDEFSDPLITTT